MGPSEARCGFSPKHLQLSLEKNIGITNRDGRILHILSCERNASEFQWGESQVVSVLGMNVRAFRKLGSGAFQWAGVFMNKT